MKCSEFEEIETNSFDGVENGYDDPTVAVTDLLENHNQAEVDEKPNEDDEEELHVLGEISIPDEWNNGGFELNINRCFNCSAHTQYCRHFEETFVELFNFLGEIIATIFPKVSIKGNYDKPRLVGEFEVYVRCLGFKSMRDEYDRYFLFKRSQKGRFPEKNDVIDHLVCLSIIYGDSKNMGIDQQLQKS